MEATDRAYGDGVRTMEDAELRKEWEREEDTRRIREIEHEMAMRFMGRSGGQPYFMDKFLQMPAQFREAFRQKDWFRAKYIYDSAIAIGLFLEAPERIREQVFGSRQHEEPIEGMFPEWMLEQVMRECVIRDRLGFECVVYRIPGEVGFYGARRGPGTSLLPAGSNPAYQAARSQEEDRDETSRDLYRDHPAGLGQGSGERDVHHAGPPGRGQGIREDGCGGD
ncbi:hypothetical protein [uncultured Acetatifactor sp.]|uniref:hypothetical protein n=1 Tax=uncultured Acetatifactor sp. TaxID=1671927 RepID=UPI002630CFF6|nr:hypothetical protein [uncultured Acetatifactor sp.]